MNSIYWHRRTWLLGMALLAACTHDPPATQRPAPPSVSTELRFDERYFDSIMLGPPYSARTQRQMAIYEQLSRLRTAERDQSRRVPDDTIWESVGEPDVPPKQEGRGIRIYSKRPRKMFPNRAARMADIRRKVDSLKVLEYIPLPPH